MFEPEILCIPPFPPTGRKPRGEMWTGPPQTWTHHDKPLPREVEQPYSPSHIYHMQGPFCGPGLWRTRRPRSNRQRNVHGARDHLSATSSLRNARSERLLRFGFEAPVRQHSRATLWLHHAGMRSCSHARAEVGGWWRRLKQVLNKHEE